MNLLKTQMNIYSCVLRIVEFISDDIFTFNSKLGRTEKPRENEFNTEGESVRFLRRYS